jgi:hypothetical protein
MTKQITKQRLPSFARWYESELQRDYSDQRDKIDLGSEANARLIYLMLKDYIANDFEV